MQEVVGSKIRERREQLNITQEQLAESSNVSRGTISALENGKSDNVLVGTLVAIAKALNTTVDYFFE